MNGKEHEVAEKKGKKSWHNQKNYLHIFIKTHIINIKLMFTG